MQTKISQIHDAVVRGSLAEVQRLVEGEPKKKLVIAKDTTGTPLIHKSVYYDHQDILEWIVDHYPSTVEQKDRVIILVLSKGFNRIIFYCVYGLVQSMRNNVDGECPLSN